MWWSQPGPIENDSKAASTAVFFDRRCLQVMQGFDFRSSFYFRFYLQLLPVNEADEWRTGKKLKWLKILSVGKMEGPEWHFAIVSRRYRQSGMINGPFPKPVGNISSDNFWNN